MEDRIKGISQNRVENLLRITERLNHIKDMDALLDKILFESRMFSNADAGSIYLRDEDKLLFSYGIH